MKIQSKVRNGRGKRPTSEMIERGVAMFKEGVSLRKIYDAVGLPPARLSEELKGRNIEVGRFKIQDSLHVEVADLYDKGASFAAIAEHFEVSVTCIDNILKSQGVIARRYQGLYNMVEDKFSSINDPESAYWFGFLMADGHNNRRLNTVIIALNSRDTETVERFRDFLCSDHPITFEKRKNGNTYVRIGITSKRMSGDLENLGMVQRKTWNHVPLNIPEEYLSHFVRGYCDGDGCIRIKRKESSSATIVGHPQLVEFIHDTVERQVGVSCRIYNCSSSDVVTYVNVQGNRNLSIFLKWLYKDSKEHFRMRRKFDKYLAFLEYYQTRNSGWEGIEQYLYADCL